MLASGKLSKFGDICLNPDQLSMHKHQEHSFVTLCAQYLLTNGYWPSPSEEHKVEKKWLHTALPNLAYLMEPPLYTFPENSISMFLSGPYA